MGYNAKIVLDSLAPNGVRLTTFECAFPRFILAEVNTHRMLSRNSASSRAIPVEKQIRRVLDDPFIPERWPANQKGMQAVEYYREGSENHRLATMHWLRARDEAVRAVEFLIGKFPVHYSHNHYEAHLDVHKQISNRLLEPFMWHTAIITATEWSNFFFLRCHKDAQPEFQKIACMMKKLYDTNKPKELTEGGWHTPYVTGQDCLEIVTKYDLGTASEITRKVSTARCARVSVLTQDGKKSIEEDIKMHDIRLHLGEADDYDEPMHMSPTEHVAEAMGPDDMHTWSGNFRGWKQYRKTFAKENR